MINNNIELMVLVKNRPITEYNHRGQVFVEGRAGSEYEIEIRNNTNGRIEAVLSVDGLSVIDGKAAGQDSSGYLINARSSIRIPGWMLDNTSVAKFAFAGKQESYSTQMSGDSRNNGVIGLMAFSERHKHVSHYVPPNYFTHNPNDYPTVGLAGAMYNGPNWRDNPLENTSPVFRGMMPKGMGMAASTSCSVQSSTTSYSTFNNSAQGDYITESFPQNNLGTAFGESASFATTKVEFTRGDMVAYSVMYYDEARGLKARGIKMGHSKKNYQQPDAFPAMKEGCSPPPGWKG